MIIHTYRNGREEKTGKLTRKKAIREHCLECMGGNQREVQFCSANLCALYPFRMGSERG